MQASPLPAEILFSIKVLPNSKKSEIIGWTLDVNNQPYLKIRLAAPPVDGKANKALCDFLAKTFAVAKRYVSVEHGETSRLKRIKITAPQVLPDFMRQELLNPIKRSSFNR